MLFCFVPSGQRVSLTLQASGATSFEALLIQEVVFARGGKSHGMSLGGGCFAVSIFGLAFHLFSPV
jgi:hypothetical protein